LRLFLLFKYSIWVLEEVSRSFIKNSVPKESGKKLARNGIWLCALRQTPNENPAKDFCSEDLVVRCCAVADGSLDLAAQAYKLFCFTWPYKTLLRSFAVQGRCIGQETRALLAAILS
jgi:hypothetical protein